MELIDKNKIINSGLAKGFVRWDEIKYAEPILTIPKNPTNGDMIKAMFPNAQIDYHENNELVEDCVTVYINGCDICQDYPFDWWNAPYKKEV